MDRSDGHDRDHEEVRGSEDEQRRPRPPEPGAELASFDRLLRRGRRRTTRKGPEDERGDQERRDGDEVEARQAREAQRFREVTARTEEVGTGHGADRRRDEHHPERPPASGLAADIDRCIAREEDGGVRGADGRAAGEHEGQILRDRAGDDEHRSRGADAVPDDQPERPACALRQPRDHERAGGRAENEGTQRHPGPRRAAGHALGKERARAPSGGEPERADRGRRRQQGQRRLPRGH